VRRSRLLLLVALSGTAVAFSVAAGPGLVQAKTTRARVTKARVTKARLVRQARLMSTTLVEIRAARDEVWRWQAVMSTPKTAYAGLAEQSRSLAFRRRVLALWSERALSTRTLAQHPPRLEDWLCIHRYEGAWNDPNGPYYGGLQMDIGFQHAYGAALLRRKGTADHWTPLEQIWVAERAYRSGRGFYPWPNTARYCGLI
jgi:hypothetical protein